MYKVYAKLDMTGNGYTEYLKYLSSTPCTQDDVAEAILSRGIHDVQIIDVLNIPDGVETPFGSVPRI